MTQSERIEIIRQAHEKVLLEKGGFISQLLPSTKEDVQDEVEHLDAVDHVKPVDFDADENEVDMDSISPTMRGVYS